VILDFRFSIFDFRLGATAPFSEWSGSAINRSDRSDMPAKSRIENPFLHNIS
jgi:hypothetical protein